MEWNAVRYSLTPDGAWFNFAMFSDPNVREATSCIVLQRGLAGYSLLNRSCLTKLRSVRTQGPGSEASFCFAV
jgi:hypothetical protein